ncbi:MAG: pyridoxal-phosphate dependent enzyme [Myxococcales bacterium]|nr:pyridoxal-phosphate dependent enzyme [Myxococcales bacterium]
MSAAAPVWLECSGCGHRVPLETRHPFTCPQATAGDDVDHVLVRRLDPGGVAWPQALSGSPYVDLRWLLSHGWRARALGVEDARLVALMEELDAAVAEVDGRGFRATPTLEARALACALPRPVGGLWVKDETGNVAGSHKARHLMGVMLHLRLEELAGRADPARRPRLAIASCGNAALAAAVVAAAARWPLDVFVPPDASPAVVERLRALGAAALVPAHGPVQSDPVAIVERTLEHRLMREAKVLAAIDAGLETTKELVPRVYDDAPPRIWPLAQRALEAHLRKLEAEGVVEREGGRVRRRPA